MGTKVFLGAKSLLTAVALVVGLDQPEGAVHPGTNQLLVVLKQLQLLEHVAALGTAPANLQVNGAGHAEIICCQFALQVGQFHAILCEFAVFLSLGHIRQNLLGHCLRHFQRWHWSAKNGRVIEEWGQTGLAQASGRGSQRIIGQLGQWAQLCHHLMSLLLLLLLVLLLCRGSWCRAVATLWLFAALHRVHFPAFELGSPLSHLLNVFPAKDVLLKWLAADERQIAELAVLGGPAAGNELFGLGASVAAGRLPLLGPGILKPDLDHSFVQPNPLAQTVAFLHGWRFVVMEKTFHHKNLDRRQMGSEPF